MNRKWFFYLLCILFIASCGKDKPKNTAPNINTLSSVVIQEGKLVTLTAIVGDKEGDDVDILWKQVNGEAVELINHNKATTHFTAPVINDTVTLLFEINAIDSKGAKANSTVSVTVENTNDSPIIILPVKQSFIEASQVSVEANISDPDGDILDIKWNQIEGLEVEWDSNGEKLFLVTPVLKDGNSIQLVFEVIATDNDGETSSSKIVFVIEPQVIGNGPDTDKDGYSDSWETTFQFDPLDSSSKPFDQTLPHKKLLELEQSYPGNNGWQIEKYEPQFSESSRLNLLTFTDKPWYEKGDSISIFVSGKNPEVQVDIYRFGYYSGQLATLKYRNSLQVEVQKKCHRPISGSYYNRCDWEKGTEFKIPNHWLSGLYMVKAWDAKSNSTATSLFLLQGVSENVNPIFWENSESLIMSALVTEAGAYNLGVADAEVGASFYRAMDKDGNFAKMDFTGNMDHVLGFKRPQTFRAQRYVLFSHLPVIANLEKHNFSISYMSEWEQSKAFLKKVFSNGKRTIIDVGHSEYHTDRMRSSIEALTEVDSIKWLSISAANTRFEKILKGAQCGSVYASIEDDFIFCRPDNRIRTKFANTLGDPETKYFGSRYVAGSSGQLTAVTLDPNTAVIKGDSSYFYSETGLDETEFPFTVNHFGFIETDTKFDDQKYGHILPFEKHLQDFLIIGRGYFPDINKYSVDPSYIRLKNCSQLLHGASLGSGLALTPKESLSAFKIGNEVKGEYNAAYIRMINGFIRNNEQLEQSQCK